jgi:membrane protease subunit HflK
MYGNGTGIAVTSISLETVNYPQAVQAAVDDAQKARNDSERFILEADEYANNIIPKARGDAARVLEDARAYRDRKIADAEGEAARFESLLAEYQKAPRVTRDRLYIEAVEEVYSNSAKVIMDVDGSGNLLYLPLDQLLKRSGTQIPSIDATRNADSQTPQNQQETRSQQDARDLRERRTRE